MERNLRLSYVDFCKVFAMFMVTMAHCAQSLSGEQFPSLLISKDSFISVNMAIFMIASGFVMNIDKMKSTGTKNYIMSKASRLLVPMTIWFLVICVVKKQLLFSLYWSYYWYLSALFMCLITIKLLTNVVSNIVVVCFVSILFHSLAPMIEFERSCYMIPFLWVGFFLRLVINRINWFYTIILVVVYAFLYLSWDVSYSIYISPFHIWESNAISFFTLGYRFLIGTVGGVAFISLARLLMERLGFSWMSFLSRFGAYTLVFYTMSFVLNSLLAKVMWHFDVFIATPGVLDLFSVIISALMMIVMYYFQVIVGKVRVLSALFLGY